LGDEWIDGLMDYWIGGLAVLNALNPIIQLSSNPFLFSVSSRS
jgi:hypothetical protein